MGFGHSCCTPICTSQTLELQCFIPCYGFDQCADSVSEVERAYMWLRYGHECVTSHRAKPGNQVWLQAHIQRVISHLLSNIPTGNAKQAKLCLLASLFWFLLSRVPYWTWSTTAGCCLQSVPCSGCSHVAGTCISLSSAPTVHGKAAVVGEVLLGGIAMRVVQRWRPLQGNNGSLLGGLDILMEDEPTWAPSAESFLLERGKPKQESVKRGLYGLSMTTFIVAWFL